MTREVRGAGAASCPTGPRAAVVTAVSVSPLGALVRNPPVRPIPPGRTAPAPRQFAAEPVPAAAPYTAAMPDDPRTTGDPTDPLPLARSLIAADTVSDRPNAPAADLCEARLRSLGFDLERTAYRDPAGVEKVNLLARRGPDPTPENPGLAWFGHTDVVPADAWDAPGGPFAPAVTGSLEEGGRLYGRGACDMKGPVACALAAAATLDPGSQTAPLWLALTADEEVAFQGARRLVRDSAAFAELRAANPPGVIGEPTSLRVVHAHKGSRLLTAVAAGEAAHSATGGGVNANRVLAAFLHDLWPLVDATDVDPAYRDPAFDPPGPSWNVTLPHAQPAMNVVPGRAVVRVYCRPVPGADDRPAVDRFLSLAERHGLAATVDDHAGGFRTDPADPFVRTTLDLCGQAEPETVCYGTDGGVFAAPRGSGGGGLSRLIVLGPGSIAQAHTAAEFIAHDQLRAGRDLYADLFRRHCGGA